MLALGKNVRMWAAVYTVAGVLGCVLNLWHVQSSDPWRFLWYLICVNVAALGIKMIGAQSLIPAGFLIMLLGVGDLSLPELLFIGCTATVLRDIRKVRGASQLLPVLFGMASVTIGIAAAQGAYRLTSSFGFNALFPVPVVASSFVLLFNYGLATTLLSEANAPLIGIYKRECRHLLPWFVAASYLAYLVRCTTLQTGWQPGVIALPILFVLDYGYRTWSRAQAEHKEELAALHRRTLEILAVAIEAKDHTTHDHLQRVRVYALEIAKELELSEAEVEALRAAALLHDIGKLAVPEHIINKPGRLTPEEFEKMKIHPVVGAEILKHVGFPYPVVPIVRSHHEKWNGSGYPDGLRGVEIPMGARILAAVDCLDALASDRQYRRALPLDQAMEHVARAAGTEFDPRVVDVLKRRYIELERLAQATSAEPLQPRLSTDVKVERGLEPSAGFERTAPAASVNDSESFLASIAAARQEAQTLFELSHDLGSTLSLDETLSLLSVRLKKLVPYDSVAIYMCRGNSLVPQYVSGDNFRLFSALEIPMGQGLSGWVAQNRKPIVNGNPSVEPGYLNDDTKFSTLRSALAVPLEGVAGVVGVLALYKEERDAFTNDHLRVLLAVASKVGICIENALKYQQAENSATTDYLTGLPNARSLFLHLDRELARCKRSHTPLAVMVCDLDGFKQINDRFGHLEGNKVLRIFADFMKAVCREYDYVARMGGDEFVIVAPGMTQQAAEDKGAHLLSLAREAGRQVCGQDFLSVSIGCAFYPEHGSDAEQLLTEADRRMYSVKQVQHERAARMKANSDSPAVVN